MKPLVLQRQGHIDRHLAIPKRLFPTTVSISLEELYFNAISSKASGVRKGRISWKGISKMMMPEE